MASQEPPIAEDEISGDEDLDENARAGGLTALSGFYLQFVATFAHIVEDWGAFSLYDCASDVPMMPVETLFSIEVGDSDFQRNRGRDIRLVQFKYSSNPSRHKIYYQELYEIVKTLVIQKRRIITANPTAQVTCILATNRPLGDNAQDVWDVANADLNHDFFKREAKCTGFKGYLRECSYKRESEKEWFDTIAQWGTNFGLTQEEIDEGVRRVASAFLEKIRDGQRTFGIHDVEESFVGFRNPNSVSEMHERSKQDIESFFTRLEVPDVLGGTGIIAPRSNLILRLQEAVQSHAVVVLSGQGGNGKSTLMAAALRRNLEDCFVVGRKVSNLPDDWLPRQVSDWRNAPSTFDLTQTLDCAIGRLASSTKFRPILVAALDALDEVELDKNRVENLIRYFEKIEQEGKPPIATLLLTCRSVEELNRLFGEPGHAHFKSASGLLIEPIEVGAFNEEDIIAAIRNSKVISRSLRLRIQREFGRTTGFETETLGPSKFAVPLNPALKDALRHPVIWGHIFDGDFRPDEQEAVLNYDFQMLGELADKVLAWFAAKCQARTEERVPSDQARRICYLVAKHCRNKAPQFDYENDWEEPLEGRSTLRGYASSVMKQAISAGLVKAKYNAYNFAWEWRHPFLMEHLVDKHSRLEAL